MLNGNGIPGSASNAGFLLSERGYQLFTPPNGLPANAPNFEYFRTEVYYDPSKRRAQQAAQKIANLFGSAELKRLPANIRQLANGAMVTVVVGQTFHGKLASAPIDQTPRKERPNVIFAPRASKDLLLKHRRRVDFPLMVPAVIERSSWTDGDRPIRRYAIDPSGKHRAVRLVYRMGSNEYWGVQMSDWEDAPALVRHEHLAADQGPHLRPLLQRPEAAHGRPAHEARALLGRQHAARHDVERDDARDREGSQTAPTGAA